MRLTRSFCCARAVTDQAVAAPPRTNSRRLIAFPEAQDKAPCQLKLAHWKGPADVRFGSLADMCGAIGHVRFTPESGHGGAKGNVRYGQKQTFYASAKPRPTARLDGAGNALTT